MAPTDRIELRGLRCVGICGVLPEERTRPQPLEIDIDVVCDLAAAGASDDLADTLDYGALAARVEQIVRDSGFELLEALAGRIAAEVTADARVVEATVAVRKLRPPVPQDLATSGVRVTRPGPAA